MRFVDRDWSCRKAFSHGILRCQQPKHARLNDVSGHNTVPTMGEQRCDDTFETETCGVDDCLPGILRCLDIEKAC